MRHGQTDVEEGDLLTHIHTHTHTHTETHNIYTHMYVI